MGAMNPVSLSAERVHRESLSIYLKVEAHVRSGRYRQAYDELQTLPRSVTTQHLMGICAMRAGMTDAALRLFRSLCLKPGTVLLRDEADDVMRINFATVLTLASIPSGALEVLQELDHRDHPAANALRGAIKDWVNTLSFWQRINWKCNRIDPYDAHVKLSFEPGLFPPEFTERMIGRVDPDPFTSPSNALVRINESHE